MGSERTASTNFRDGRNFNPRIPYGMRLATIKHTSSFRVLLQFFLSNFCTVFPQYGAAGFHQELHHMTAQTKTGTSPPCLLFPRRSPKTNPPAATGGAREGKDDGDTDAQTAEDLRRLDRQGVSRSEIARRPDVDRATVAKYADMDDMTPKPPTDRRRGSKIDPYAALVDGWLEADRRPPRKQRHTTKRVRQAPRGDRVRRRPDDAGVRETLARGEQERFQTDTASSSGRPASRRSISAWRRPASPASSWTTTAWSSRSPIRACGT